jgi:hypothetical protein
MTNDKHVLSVDGVANMKTSGFESPSRYFSRKRADWRVSDSNFVLKMVRVVLLLGVPKFELQRSSITTGARH